MIGRSIVKLCQFVVGIAIAFLFAIGSSILSEHRYFGVTSKNGAIAGALVCTILLVSAVMVHELGHFLLARATGMKVVWVRLGPILCISRRRGVRVRWQWQKGDPWGSVCALPDPDRNLSMQFVPFIAGGPLLNIAVAAVALLAIHAWDSPSRDMLTVFALANLFLGFANLLPIGSRIPSDGSRLVAWLFRGQATAESTRLAVLFGHSLKGQRTRDLDQSEIAALRASADPGINLTAGYIALRRAMDLGDDLAFQAIVDDCKKALASVAAPLRQALQPAWLLIEAEVAFRHAIEERSADEVRKVLSDKAAKHFPPYLRCRLQAAESYAVGRYEEATALSEKALRECAGSFDPTAVVEEGKLLKKLVHPIPQPLSA